MKLTGKANDCLTEPWKDYLKDRANEAITNWQKDRGNYASSFPVSFFLCINKEAGISGSLINIYREERCV